MIPSKKGEQLFLQRDNAQSICVDLPKPLPQHQLDGIRFLYRHFKKRAPGVILNDPSGYGKQLQVALFLSALRLTLKKPILILSNSVQDWKQQFEKWTNCGDDVAVESPNPYTGKQICINPIRDGLLFSRRSWSIVVAHDDDSTKELLKINFSADYKIWVTAADLREDLRNLASIYEWLHPNQKFDVSLFTAKGNNWKDVVEKALLLDAVLEDFLIRRTDFIMLFDKPKKHTPPKPSPVNATRKNKDPTGTKVKRSKKRRIIEDDEDDNITNINESTASNENILNNKNVSVNNSISVYISNDIDDNMDVESFIHNEKPIQSEEFDFFNSNETSQVTALINDSESMEIDFGNAVKEIVDHEKSLHISKDQEEIVDHEKSSHILKHQEEILDHENSLHIPKNQDSQNGHIDPENGLDEMENIVQETISEPKNNEAEENKNGVMVPATEESQNILDYHDEISDDTKKNIVIPETDKENTQESFKNDTHNLEAKDSNDPKSNDWKINDDIVPKNETLVINNSNIIEDGDKGGANNDNTNSKTNEVVKKKTKMEEFDAEMAEIEAKALKRFKGSILDSLF